MKEIHTYVLTWQSIFEAASSDLPSRAIFLLLNKQYLLFLDLENV